MMDAAQCGGDLPRFQEPLQLELGWTGRYYEVVVVVVRGKWRIGRDEKR